MAPPANRFGRVSPTTAADVLAELGAAVDLILDGGPCAVGVESTIVGLLQDGPVLLRPGGITPDQVEAVLGRGLARPDCGKTPRVPGALASHYAPATPLVVSPAGSLAVRAEELTQRGQRVAALVLGRPPMPLPVAHVEAMPTAAADYARGLYAALRRLDTAGFDVILVEAPPQGMEWLAVHDRLTRAAHPPAGSA